MRKIYGLLISEWVTAILGVVVSVAVGFGLYVSHERDNMVALAEASIETLQNQVIATAEMGTPIACDDSLANADVLANPFISLSIKPVRIDESNREAGFGPGVYVHSNKEADGNDTFVTAQRLHKALKEKDENALRKVRIEKVNKKPVDISYAILLSDTAVCEKATKIARNQAINGGKS